MLRFEGLNKNQQQTMAINFRYDSLLISANEATRNSLINYLYDIQIKTLTCKIHFASTSGAWLTVNAIMADHHGWRFTGILHYMGMNPAQVRG
jgi:hypothetical protein